MLENKTLNQPRILTKETDNFKIHAQNKLKCFKI